jgi:hypothetical protein
MRVLIEFIQCGSARAQQQRARRPEHKSCSRNSYPVPCRHFDTGTLILTSITLIRAARASPPVRSCGSSALACAFAPHIIVQGYPIKLESEAVVILSQSSSKRGGDSSPSAKDTTQDRLSQVGFQPVRLRSGTPLPQRVLAVAVWVYFDWT